MNRLGRWLLSHSYLLLVVLFALPLYLALRSLEPATMAHLGKEAPELSLPLLEGDERLSLAGLRGQVVLLDFFATWCPPCREELPALARLSARYQERGLTVIGIDSIDREQGGLESVRRFVTRLGLRFPIALDYGEKASGLYRVEAIPTVVLIDREGVVREVFQGSRSEAVLEAAILELLEP